MYDADKPVAGDLVFDTEMPNRNKDVDIEEVSGAVSDDAGTRRLYHY